LTAFPEAATVLSGLLASALIGGFYVGVPLGVLSRRIRMFRGMSAKPWTVTLLGGIVALMVGKLLVIPALLMLSTSIVVLSTMLVAAILTKSAISK
jgi:hypothetical protein